MANQLRGVLPVVQTPFRDDDSIDVDVLRTEIDWLFSVGVDGVTVALASEILRLTTEERRELAEAVCRAADGRGPVVIGVGAEATCIAASLARHAADSGAAAVMATPPFSAPMPPSEIASYYAAIIDAAGIPLIVQDASGYIGTPMTIALQADLMETYGPDRVLFKPEASPLGPTLSALLDATDGEARMFEGSGGIALVESYHRGVIGSMPGSDLADAIVAIWHALEADDMERADRIRLPLTALISMLPSLDAYVRAEKHLLVKRGVFNSDRMRAPVSFGLDDVTRDELDRLFEMIVEAVEG